MNSFFTYSVLQYKHSLILGESINVGILFHFPDNNYFEFVRGDATRVKSIYPNFDNALFNNYIKNITDKVKKHVTLFNNNVDKSNFSQYIREFILAEDAAGLLFNEPVTVKNTFSNYQDAINAFSKLLLPGINTERAYSIKHNENFILSTFKGYFQKNSWENNFKKNVVINASNFKLKFELAYDGKQNKRLIKPLSFDLTDEIAIQNKAAITFGHLVALKDYAKTKNVIIDLLIAEPQNNNLSKHYQNALDFIDGVKISKEIVAQKDWKSFSQTTFDM